MKGPVSGVARHPADGFDEFAMGRLQIIMKDRRVVGYTISEKSQGISSLMHCGSLLFAAGEKCAKKRLAPNSRVIPFGQQCHPKAETQCSDDIVGLVGVFRKLFFRFLDGLSCVKMQRNIWIDRPILPISEGHLRCHCVSEANLQALERRIKCFRKSHIPFINRDGFVKVNTRIFKIFF